MNRTNKMVRDCMKEYHLKQYEVAEMLLYSETAFSRLMRYELPIKRQIAFVKHINREVEKQKEIERLKGILSDERNSTEIL